MGISLEGFNKLKRDNRQTNKNYYEQDSYYVPIHITIKLKWKQMYKKIYNFNCDKSVLIKPID